MKDGRRDTGRREFLTGAAAAVTGVVIGGLVANRKTPAPADTPPPDPNKAPGLGATEVSRGRSPFETPRRTLSTSYAGIPQVSLTDLSYQSGVITPSDLHYERHHNGVPQIAPRQYQLLIHGMVDKPKVFTLADLKRFPQVSVQHFMECSGNSSLHYAGAPPSATIVQTHGLFSNSEWTGVPLEFLFREVGVQKGTQWFLAESYDGAVMTRSVPVNEGWGVGIIAFGQNGEPLRPEQGYPARLLLPGWEGNINVKWIRRIKLADRPFMTREETSKYTDPLPREGRSRQFTMEWDAKSVITSPSGGMTIPSGPGFVEISGLAWSGRGSISKVEVSTDGGRSWGLAALQGPTLPMAATRFRYPWQWDGKDAVILSRCTDDIGYVQPTRNQLLLARGVSNYHFNGIQAWKVGADGNVSQTYHEPPLITSFRLPDELAGTWPVSADCGRLFV